MTTSEKPGLTARWQITGLALGSGLVVLLTGTWIESAIITAVGATGHDLEWVSDIVASVAVTSLTYLWLRLRASRKRVLDLERSQIAIDEQFRLAAEIQRNLLPQVPPTTPGYMWAARMEAAHEVGGDFYDFVGRDDGSVLVILGDVSGKGIPAALLQSSLTTLFRMYATTTAEPDVIAGLMSEALLSQTGGRPYATAILARLDRSPRRITYVNAGHPRGLLLRGTATLELSAGGPPLGLLAHSTYEHASLDLQPGDFCVLVTDGITEALEGIPLPLAGAVNAGNLSNSATPEQGCEYLLRIAGQASGPPGADNWNDDRTVFALRVLDER